jgi:hypothetical protein
MDYHRCLAQEALTAVLSDDHNAQVGEAVLRGIVARVAAVEGTEGLQRGYHSDDTAIMVILA